MGQSPKFSIFFDDFPYIDLEDEDNAKDSPCVGRIIHPATESLFSRDMNLCICDLTQCVSLRSLSLKGKDSSSVVNPDMKILQILRIIGISQYISQCERSISDFSSVSLKISITSIVSSGHRAESQESKGWEGVR